MEQNANATDVTFSIRDYRAADFDRLWEIDQLCFPPGIAYTQMELSGFITRRNAITLVTQVPGREAGDEGATVPHPRGERLERIRGFVVAHPIRRKYGRILTLDIHPNSRRLGLAKALMHLCESRLRSLGCSEVYLETAVNNEPALRLYRKIGYRILRTLPEYYSSHSLDAFQMGKML